MNQENFLSQPKTEQLGNIFTKVTPLSKYLAMVLFVLLPFIGGWIGYYYVPVKVVEVEKVTINTNDSTASLSEEQEHIADTNWSGVYNIRDGNVYYTDDSGTVNMSNIFVIDTASFQPLNPDVDQIDASLDFRVPYARDSKSVFIGPDRIYGADPQTFSVGLMTEPHSYVWSADKNDVYYHGVPLRVPDPKTFEVITEGSQKDCGYLGYGKDTAGVYYGPELIFHADPLTFKVLTGEYSKDNENTFFRIFRTVPPEDGDYCGGLG